VNVVDHLRDLLHAVADGADEKKGQDIVILEVGSVLAITDAFVITNGANARQVRSIVEEVERRVDEAGGPKPLRIEGLDDARWVLMDYGDFVVHVFLDEVRAYYDIERLWSDAPRIEWQPSSGAASA
jgi:ribosome-associated protein